MGRELAAGDGGPVRSGLKSFRGILMDVGNADGLAASNAQFSAALKRLGVAHEYEVYEGNHGNRVGARFIGQWAAILRETPGREIARYSRRNRHQIGI